MTGLLEKYRPAGLEGVVGHSRITESVVEWANMGGAGKGMLLYGPTGTGKTLIVEILARQKGLDLLHLDASDSRNREDIEAFMQTTQTRPLFAKGKIILIDEVDGIPSVDRGAVSAIAMLIKSSRYPVFLTANNPWLPKLAALRPHCELVKLNKVPYPAVEKRLREICSGEGKAVKEEIIKHIARTSGGDMRSAINDLEAMFTEGGEPGYRERERSIFEILPLVFNSKNIAVTRQAINSADKDPDEVFWWIENNAHLVFKSADELASAFDILSKADVLRGRVVAQQNWRFRAYMVDLLSGISLFRKEARLGFVQFQPPRRFSQMADRGDDA